MATVIQELQDKKAALQVELANVESEIAAIPSEFHVLEAELWAKIKSWFGKTDAPTVPPVVQDSAPPA